MNNKSLIALWIAIGLTAALSIFALVSSRGTPASSDQIAGMGGTPNYWSPVSQGSAVNISPIFAANVGQNMTVPTLSSLATSTGGSLPTGTTYFFQVAAFDGVGTSSFSNESSTVTGGTTPNVTIAFSTSTGAQSYDVFFATSSNAEANYFVVANQTGSYSFTTTTAALSGSAPSQNSAYVNKLVSNGTSWFYGGSAAIGATSSQGFILHGAATTTCYLYTATVSGSLTTSTISCP